MRRFTLLFFIILLLAFNLWSQTIDSTFVQEVKVTKGFALSEIDESTTDENADVAGQNFSTLATFSNDPFLSEVGFNLSGFRFSPRGFKNKYEQTYINDIEFNSLIRGNFNYSMIGGMNDVTRNATTADYLQPALFSFGDLAGAQNYDMRAGSYAHGTKITGTYTNRNYQGRLMVSHHTGLNRKGWAFSALLGTRYAYQGAVEGTFYHNLSYFFGVEKQWANGRHSLSLSTFGSPVQRAQQSASVDEAYNLLNNTAYNSYWGFMPDGTKRNQRVVSSFDPTVVLSHVWKPNRSTKLTTGFAFDWNRYGSTALNWFNNAADPRPDYYRYLPSYTAVFDPILGGTPTDDYINDAAFWAGANKGKDRGRSQILWDEIYEANYNNNLYGANKSALYLMEERRNDASNFSLNSTLEKKITEEMRLTAGVGGRYTIGHTFDMVVDLLGAEYHLDIDKYGERDFPGNPNVKQNNLRNPNRIVREGDIFGYDYYMNVANANVWAQMHHNYEKVEFYYAAKFTYTGFQRDGKMENGRYPNVLGADGKYITRSYGKGVFHSYYDPSAKAGVVYKITGRHLLSANGIFKMQAPTIYDAYTAPRISDEMLPNLKSEMIGGADLNYVITYPKINARISGYFTEFMNQAQQIAYYNDAYGTFVHHSISDAHTRNYGVEAGLNWKVWKNLTLSVAGTWSQFKYVSNPTTGTIRYENGSEIVTDPKHVNPVIRGFHVGGSPEIAGTISLQYFWKYWWFEISANGFGNSYLAPSFIQRTQDVVTKVADKDPTGKILIAEFEKQNFTPSDYFEDNYFLEQFVNGMEYTKQTRLDKWDWKKFNGVPITMDISISKLFYFKGGKQLNINLNLVNVLNNTGIRTGGYEQGRIPMVRDGFDYDNLNKFPAKYYYMQGINVFLNVGFKF